MRTLPFPSSSDGGRDYIRDVTTVGRSPCALACGLTGKNTLGGFPREDLRMLVVSGRWKENIYSGRLCVSGWLYMISGGREGGRKGGCFYYVECPVDCASALKRTRVRLSCNLCAYECAWRVSALLACICA